MRAAEGLCSPARQLAAWRRLARALLMGIGTALLMAWVPLQGHARNAARLDGSAAHCRAPHHGDQHPRNRQGPFVPPPSGLLTCTGDLDGAARQGASAEQRPVSAALAYVLSPPPATRGVLPRYLPRISPGDARPIPSLATTTPPRRPAWRQARHVRHAHGHQCRLRQGARHLLAELPGRCRAQRARSCRHDQTARGLRFHRHRLCPK